MPHARQVVGLLFASLAVATWRPPAATAAPTVAAHLACADGKAALGKKAVTLVGDVRCRIVLDGPPGDTSARALVWIEQGSADAEPSTIGGGLVAEGDDISFELERAFTRGTDFKACTPFTIHGQVVIGDAPAWDGTLAVKAACKKPRKLKGKLGCSFAAEAGTFSYPGNGSKAKPMIQGNLTCEVTVPLPQVKKGEVYRVDFRVAGGAWHAAQELVGTMDGYTNSDTIAGDSFDPEGNPVEGEFHTCTVTTIEARVRNVDEQVAWTAKLKVPQDCGGG